MCQIFERHWLLTLERSAWNRLQPSCYVYTVSSVCQIFCVDAAWEPSLDNWHFQDGAAQLCVCALTVHTHRTLKSAGKLVWSGEQGLAHLLTQQGLAHLLTQQGLAHLLTQQGLAHLLTQQASVTIAGVRVWILVGVWTFRLYYVAFAAVCRCGFSLGTLVSIPALSVNGFSQWNLTENSVQISSWTELEYQCVCYLSKRNDEIISHVFDVYGLFEENVSWMLC